jgi:hypothetical protein
METIAQPPAESQRPLRAYIEIVAGQLFIIPIATTDIEERDVLDAVRVFLGGWEPGQ